MLFRIASASLAGIEAYPVEVEADISLGFPQFITVGLPDPAVRESKERVRAALKNCGYDITARKITINLAPADRKKEGSAFDLPIALGFLAQQGIFAPERLRDYLFVGELALDGRLKPVPGVLPIAILVKRLGFQGLVVPHVNEKEAALVPGLAVYGLRDLVEVIGLMTGATDIHPTTWRPEDLMTPPAYAVDFQEVKGQWHVKRALEVAAAGGHNVLLVGPPGAGKTMLARRLPTILPQMTFDEMLDVTQVYSAAGLLAGYRGRELSPVPSPSPYHHRRGPCRRRRYPPAWRSEPGASWRTLPR